MGKTTISVSTDTRSLIKATIVVAITLSAVNMLIEKFRPRVEDAIDRFRGENFDQASE